MHSITAIILLVDIVVLSLYIFITHRTFGVLPNLSISYYHYERKHKYFGLMFPALMVLLCGTLLPIWIYDTATGSAWAQHFVCLPCIALLCLLVVASTARYKSTKKLIYVHYAFAIIAATVTVAWIFLVAYRTCYIGIAILLAEVAAGIYTRTLRSCTLWWLEGAAFYSILFILLVNHLFALSI